ncbi:STAS domain-containing protein [Dactylosporangium cerinum]
MHTGIDAPGTPLVEIMVTEELDAGSEPRVRALLEDALTLHPEQLIVDLAGCPFIDATAIGMLLDIHRQVWTSGGRLTLRALTPGETNIANRACKSRVTYGPGGRLTRHDGEDRVNSSDSAQ